MQRRAYFIFSVCLFASLFNPATAENNRLKKFLAVQEMVGMVQREEAQFVVMLRRYFIEGREYTAFQINVSPDHAKHLVQTNDGFEGYFKFPKEIVHQEAWKGNLINDRIVQVKLKVRLDDINMIIGLTRAGKQFSVYPN